MSAEFCERGVYWMSAWLLRFRKSDDGDDDNCDDDDDGKYCEGGGGASKASSPPVKEEWLYMHPARPSKAQAGQQAPNNSKAGGACPFRGSRSAPSTRSPDERGGRASSAAALRAAQSCGQMGPGQHPGPQPQH